MSRWSRLAFVASILAVALSGIWYTNYVQRQSEKKFCDIMNTTYELTSTQPSSKDPRIMKYRRQIAELRHNLGCG